MRSLPPALHSRRGEVSAARQRYYATQGRQARLRCRW